MTASDWTKVILIFVAIFLTVYDIIIVALYGMDASISMVIYNASQDFPIIPFMIGGICFHIFFPLWFKLK